MKEYNLVILVDTEVLMDNTSSIEGSMEDDIKVEINKQMLDYGITVLSVTEK